MNAFNQAFVFITRADIEGGYVNDPHDPGGETKFGISKRAYPHLNIATLTKAQAKQLYYQDYWLKAECPALPARLAIVTFDTAVSQGVGRAKRLLQRAARVRVDGKIGPITHAAIKAAAEDTLLLDLLSHRLRSYATTRNARRYMRGWSRRVLALHALLLTVPFLPARKSPFPTPKPKSLR